MVFLLVLFWCMLIHQQAGLWLSLMGAIGGILSIGYDRFSEKQHIQMQEEAIQDYSKLISQWFGPQDQMPPNLISAPANASSDISIVIHE